MDVEGVGEGVGVTVSCRVGDLGMRRLHAAAPALNDILFERLALEQPQQVQALHFIGAGLLHVQASTALIWSAGTMYTLPVKARGCCACAPLAEGAGMRMKRDVHLLAVSWQFSTGRAAQDCHQWSPTTVQTLDFCRQAAGASTKGGRQHKNLSHAPPARPAAFASGVAPLIWYRVLSKARSTFDLGMSPSLSYRSDFVRVSLPVVQGSAASAAGSLDIS